MEISKQRGRPRDEAVDRAVLDATRSLLEDAGWGGVSIERVAREAGVGKASVYRRWPSKAALVLDATIEPLPELDPDADFADALGELIDSTGRDFARADVRAALPGLVAECLTNTDEMNRRRIDPEIALVASLLQAGGRGRREARKDASLLFELYVGAILMRVLRGAEPSPAYRRKLIEVLRVGMGLDF